MAASREWTEWHLTPQGWVEGSQKTDFGSTPSCPIPENRVLTCRYEVTHSGYGKPSHMVRKMWRAENELETQALLEKYGTCPEHL